MAYYLIERGYFDISSPFRMDHYLYKLKLKDAFPPWNPEDFKVSPKYLLNKYGTKFQETLDTLFLARKPNVLWLGLNTVIVYFLSLFFLGGVPSLLVAVLFGLNNLLIEMSLRAQTDGLFLFLLNLDLLFIMMTFNKNRNFFLGVGIITGLLWQTKINGAMLLIIFNAIVALNFVFKWFWKKENKFTVLLIILSTNILAFLVFVNTSFYLIQSPIKNTIDYYKIRLKEARSQAKEIPDARLDNPLTRIYAMSTNMTVNYNYVSLSKHLIPKSISVLTSSKAFLILYFLFIVAGMIMAPKILLGVFILTEVIMSSYLLLNWDRYYIQLYFFYIFFFVYGLMKFFKMLSYLSKLKSVGG